MSEAARRFYKSAKAVERDDAFVVTLDERTLKTPKGAPFHAPTRALAEVVATEWDAQTEKIIPSTMPITQLAFAAIDITPKRRDELPRTIAQYAETDLVAHRAEAPAALIARQTALWDPIVEWGATRFGFRLAVVSGIIATPAPHEQRAAIETAAAALDDFRLTALTQAVTLAGSALIGFALLEGELSAETAFAAAALDDLWSLENWGEDAEARTRLDRQRAEFENIERFIALLS